MNLKKKLNSKKNKSKNKISRKNTKRNQKGGFTSSIFDKTNGTVRVAAYCYTRDSSTKNTFYFGFVRKLQNDGRIRLRGGPNTGAAATESRFMGKWTSIGGSTKIGITYLKAVINELNDETNSNFNNFSDVDVSEIKPSYKKNAGAALILKNFSFEKNVLIFIFEIPDNSIFFNVFPKEGRTSPDLLTSSHGEIDAVQSYSMNDIMTLQTQNNNNYFIYYCINNFNKFLKPFISTLSQTFSDRWQSYIPFNDDNTERIPTELTHAPYIEQPGNKYS